MSTDQAPSKFSRSVSRALPQLSGTTTLPNRLYEQLERAIVGGALTPGQRLNADELAEHFGVSRIPVREALSSLARAGWVDIVPWHGVHVRGRTEAELGELFDFRAEVEGLVARWAARRRTDDDLVALTEAVAGSADHAHLDDEALMEVNTRFRDAMRDAAHNSVLAATSGGLEKRAQFYFSTVIHRLGDEWMRVHEQVLHEVRAGDADAAARLTADHIAATGSAVHSLLFG